MATTHLRAEQRKAAAAEVAAWIEAHGSSRLKGLAAAGIEHGAVYRDERLALERPGWRRASEDDGELSEPRTAPEAALDLLDAARAVDPAAELKYYVVWDEAAEEMAAHGYLCTAVFLGRDIVTTDRVQCRETKARSPDSV